MREVFEHVQRNAGITLQLFGQRLALAAALAGARIDDQPGTPRPPRHTVSDLSVITTARDPKARIGSHAASHGLTKPSSPMVSDMPSTMK